MSSNNLISKEATPTGDAAKRVLLNMFGRPKGFLGRLGGMIMARTNRKCAAWVVGLLEVHPNDRVLELGFGPGLGIELLAQTQAGSIAGVDPSREMLEQATDRNQRAIESGHVALRLGSAERLPFEDGTFDKVMAINSMQVWPDATAGLRELWRVVKPGGKIALGFTVHSGQQKAGLIDKITSAAAFSSARLTEMDDQFCVLAERS